LFKNFTAHLISNNKTRNNTSRSDLIRSQWVHNIFLCAWRRPVCIPRENYPVYIVRYTLDRIINVEFDSDFWSYIHIDTFCFTVYENTQNMENNSPHEWHIGMSYYLIKCLWVSRVSCFVDVNESTDLKQQEQLSILWSSRKTILQYIAY